MTYVLQLACIGLYNVRSTIAAVSLTDPVPLTEHYSRSLKDYKGLTWDTITPKNAAPLVRVRNMSTAEFEDLVRRGYPFIVEDCVPTDSEFQQLRCSDFASRYPKEHMKAEYTPGQQHINLENPEWYTVKKPTAKAPKHLSRGSPISGPYVWHVKDETEGKKTKPELMAKFPVPYFLRDSALNANEVRDSFEMWFALEGGGTQAHSDAYCETTISMQLRGRKTWRVGTFPNITNAFEPHEYHDGVIYRHDKYWKPESEEIVEPGQCFVFPMGLIHETYLPAGSAGDDGCSVATTFQFQDPQPVYHWRNFLTRWGLSHFARDEPCVDRMKPYVLLGSSWKQMAQKESTASIKEHCQSVFNKLDTNGDGRLVKEELLSKFQKMGFNAPWTEMRDQTVLQAAASEKADFMATDALLYHDLDEDAAISLADFQESVLKYLAVVRRTKTIKSTKKRQQLLEKERAWVKRHLCGGEACGLLDQLEEDFKAKSAGVRRSSEL
eukprot:TRINITY_DN80631_c0_g1_i1.p1 TRINITY_DN80631_c0_g1~~TRINITY_DN80631_c0_g1_i1.p1  ORF type:complete len:495 (+),score=82.76 TRINITY_DN80631_c0_g1_i1:58-1542(+)